MGKVRKFRRRPGWRVYRLPAALSAGGHWRFTSSPLIRWSSNKAFLELCLPRSRRQRREHAGYRVMHELLLVPDSDQLTHKHKRLLIDLSMCGIRARDWIAAASLRSCLGQDQRQLIRRSIAMRILGALTLAGFTTACYHPSFGDQLYSYGFDLYALILLLLFVLYSSILLVDHNFNYVLSPGWLPSQSGTDEEEGEEPRGFLDSDDSIFLTLGKAILSVLQALLLIIIVIAIMGLVLALLIGIAILCYFAVRHLLPPFVMIPILSLISAWCWINRARVRRCMRGRTNAMLRQNLQDYETAYQQFIRHLEETSTDEGVA